MATANMHAKYLAGMKARWDGQKEASKAAAAGARVPDGTYLAKLLKSELRTMKQKDEDKKEIMALAVMHTFQISEGDYAGQKLFVFDKTATDQNIMHLQKNFRLLGEDMDDADPEKLPSCCENATRRKPGVRLSAKTGEQGYQNVYIQKGVALDDATPDVVGEDVGGDPTEDGVEIEVPEPTATPPKAKTATKPAAAAKPKAKAAPEPEPEPEPVATDDDVVSVDDEPEVPPYEAGDAVQYKMKGAAHRGLVIDVKEHPPGSGTVCVFIKDDADKKRYAVKIDNPDLAKVD